MTLETLKQLLQDYGLKANKTFGQNFLMDEIVLQDMVEVAKVSKNDVVVEVGPGIGNLTQYLLDAAGSVLAIEKDEQFISRLNSLKKKNKHFQYELMDVLKFNTEDYLELKDCEYKVVANIPYYVTGKIIQHFLHSSKKPISMTLLIQKEVAQNLTAKPGQLNLLAISVQLFADVELVEVVPAHKFYPTPKVDSSVVHIKLHDKPKYQLQDEKFFFQVLRACFAGKRKQIHNTLKNNLGLDKEVVEKVLQAVNLSSNVRPQQLSVEDWIKLVENISELS